MKRSIVLSLILAICCLLPFTASAEEWSDFFALNEETAIGYVPNAEDINLEGIDVSRETLAGLLSVDRDLWRKETEGIHSFYAQFGDKLPQALREELAGLEDRLKD